MMGLISVILITLLVKGQSEEQACKLIGQTGYLEFSKDGDLIIGGIFSLNRSRVLDNNGYHAYPSPFCTR